ncbi:MAG: heavy metal translocating P-type ATPase [Deltaproteobacteria bacterium]|nr:heavy metal translocating P-type ATPase [Deltaproteobacteria bacterium]
MSITDPSAPVAASDPAACAHCSLPIPAARLTAGDRFCCNGCEIVHDALAAGGLTSYYGLPDRQARAAQVTDRSYAELDDPAFQKSHVEQRPDGNCSTALYLEDLRCGACVWLLERTPRLVPGVLDVRIDLGRGRADVVFDPKRAQLSQVAKTIDHLGHPVHPFRGVDRDKQRRREDRSLLIKIGVAGATAGNVMLLAAALYAGSAAGMAARDVTFFRWASLFAVPALLFAAMPFWRGALGALRAKQLHLDLPIAIGIAAGLGWGLHNVISGTGELYFDSLAMLVFLLLAARWLQARQHRRAAGAAEILYALTPSSARRVGADEQEVVVAIEAVAVGDRILARAGETIAVDGIVEKGRSAVDAGLLTGEPRPVDVEPGDSVVAGAVNLSAPIIVRATATGEDTRVGRLAARLTELASDRPQITQLVDLVAGRFVVVVLCAAALTTILWWHAGAGTAVEHAMALLVVTCPCALALAAPLSFGLAIGRAARRGVLVKGHDALERLATPGTMVLDKTGTITRGQLRLVGWTGDARCKRAAIALERASAHPLARAMVDADEVSGLALAPLVVDVHEELGRGISGTVDGVALAIGSPRWIGERATIGPELAAEIAATASRGETPVVIAKGDHAVAIARFADPIRPDAAASIRELGALGYKVEILSGDDPRVVAQVGATLGLASEDCRGGATPEDKLARIQDLATRGPVIMVGDGVNDAAALAAATAGVAVHGGAEASVEAADVFLRRPGLAPVVEVMRGSRRALGAVRRSLRISLTYNLTMGTLAMAGIVHPLLAAALMPLSSLTVLLIAAQSRAFRTREPAPPGVA